MEDAEQREGRGSPLARSNSIGALGVLLLAFGEKEPSADLLRRNAAIIFKKTACLHRPPLQVEAATIAVTACAGLPSGSYLQPWRTV